MSKRRKNQRPRYLAELPPAPLLNAEQAGWLRKLVDQPMRRDGNSDPLRYGMATIFLDYRLIEPFTEFSKGAGIAHQSWRCWRITKAGEEALRHVQRQNESRSVPEKI
jgi:hypothetical protein